MADQIKNRAEALAAAEGIQIEFLRKKIRKEDRVQQLLAQRGDRPGLICILSAMEKCDTYRLCKKKKGWGLRPDSGKCLHYELLAKFRDQSVREAAVLIVLSTLQCKPEPFPLQGPEIHAFRHAATEAPSVPRSISVSVAARPALCDQSQDLVDRQRQDAEHQMAHHLGVAPHAHHPRPEFVFQSRVHGILKFGREL